MVFLGFFFLICFLLMKLMHSLWFLKVRTRQPSNGCFHNFKISGITRQEHSAENTCLKNFILDVPAIQPNSCLKTLLFSANTWWVLKSWRRPMIQVSRQGISVITKAHSPGDRYRAFSLVWSSSCSYQQGRHGWSLKRGFLDACKMSPARLSCNWTGFGRNEMFCRMQMNKKGTVCGFLVSFKELRII